VTTIIESCHHASAHMAFTGSGLVDKAKQLHKEKDEETHF